MIVCDVDNTLADLNTVLRVRFPGGADRENRPDWAPVPTAFWATPEGLDLLEAAAPFSGAAETLAQLVGRGGVRYVTARPLCAGPLTRIWLARYGFPDGEVLTECGGARRADLAAAFGTRLAIDDDLRAAWEYRILGIPCLLRRQPYNSADICAFSDWRDLRGVLDAAGCGDLVAGAVPGRRRLDRASARA